MNTLWQWYLTCSTPTRKGTLKHLIGHVQLKNVLFYDKHRIIRVRFLGPTTRYPDQQLYWYKVEEKLHVKKKYYFMTNRIIKVRFRTNHEISGSTTLLVQSWREITCGGTRKKKKKFEYHWIMGNACLSVCITGSTQRISIIAPCTLLDGAQIELDYFSQG
jgi:hypothetical protein